MKQKFLWLFLFVCVAIIGVGIGRGIGKREERRETTAKFENLTGKMDSLLAMSREHLIITVDTSITNEWLLECLSTPMYILPQIEIEYRLGRNTKGEK